MKILYSVVIIILCVLAAISIFRGPFSHVKGTGEEDEGGIGKETDEKDDREEGEG